MNSTAKSETTTDVFDRVAKSLGTTTATMEAFGTIQREDGTLAVPVFHAFGARHSCDEVRISADGKCPLVRKNVGVVHAADILNDDNDDDDGNVVLVWGVIDAMSLHEIGIEAIGLIGDSLDDEYADHFAGFNVVVLPPLDSRGRENAVEVADALRSESVRVRIATLPGIYREIGGISVSKVLSGATGKQLIQQAIEDAKGDPSSGGEALRAMRCSKPVAPLPTADPDINPQLATVQIVRKRMSIVGGGPGNGKTTLAYQQGFHAMVADPSLRVLSVNVEMTSADLLRKQLTRLSGVPLNEIPADESDWGPELTNAMAVLEAMADRILFMGEPYDVPHILEAVDTFDPNLVIIDYVQRIKVPGIGDARRATNAVMEALREIAASNRAVLAISALSRSKGPGDYGVGLSAFRESSELEYAVDTAYVLTVDDKSHSQAKLHHVKNRHGATHDIHLDVDFSTMTFSDASAVEGDVAEDGGGDLPTWGTSLEGGE